MLIELIRKMPVSKRFQLARSLTAFAASLKQQNIRERHPDFSKEEVAAAFAADHYSRSLTDGLRGALEQRPTLVAPDLLDATVPLVEVFEQLDVGYYITGSVANSLYGMQRASFAIDFVADLSLEQADCFPAKLSQIYYIDEVALKEAIYYRTRFEGIHFESMLKITVSFPRQRAFDQEVFRRVQQHALVEQGSLFYIASPEDVVLTQLEEYRGGGEVADDQWNEILGVLKIQGEALDLVYLQRWACMLKIDDLLTQACIDAGRSG